MTKAADASDIKNQGGNDAVREFLDSAQAPSGYDEVRPPEFSDDALALDFAERHKDDLRYVAAWGRWLHFDGRHWEYDETLNVFDLVRVICREAAVRAAKNIRARIVSAKTVSAVERLAKSDRRLAATIEQWDSDPMLLNTPGAVIDLRTSASRPPRPADYMTKMTAVTPGGTCPTWEKFIARITGGDTELAKFLQRVVGYLLTGLTVEHALFFGYGTGANGKSVMINTVSWIAFGYHKTAPIETFTLSSSDRHPTELAGLQGARIVTAIETEQGRRWAEARIKALTGGDPISARFMRQDFFEFTPQFKLLIAGNHKPSLRSVDEAMRRRFHLIPFNVTIPLEERDPNLAEKLKAEGQESWLG
jgi:putative DNA primase/helicase